MLCFMISIYILFYFRFTCFAIMDKNNKENSFVGEIAFILFDVWNAIVSRFMLFGTGFYSSERFATHGANQIFKNLVVDLDSNNLCK